ncbi:hypothetical protein E2C01_012860 [Portunus trituberculatus]|uniref:Uncharacterized protein n=1 Tax=Portunus trituberculatus TaxID=210409 RepID=A0A5B7DET5_PORTR|nr:hypothetical protein [Portunus trituberculatus]
MSSGNAGGTVGLTSWPNRHAIGSDQAGGGTVYCAGSRSGSPSSRLSYQTYASPGDSGTMGRTRRRSGIPRSTGTSREPSPTRYTALSGISPSKCRSRSISGTSEMPPQVPVKSRQVMAQKILQQSREAESALADALVSLPPGGVLEQSVCCVSKQVSLGRPHTPAPTPTHARLSHALPPAPPTTRDVRDHCGAHCISCVSAAAHARKSSWRVATRGGEAAVGGGVGAAPWLPPPRHAVFTETYLCVSGSNSGSRGVGEGGC